MGIFVIQKWFNYQNRLLTTFTTRFEAKRFIRNVRNVEHQFKRLQEVIQTHKLKKIEDTEKEFIEAANKAIKEGYKLFTQDMLILEKVLDKLPKIPTIRAFLQRLIIKYKKNEDIRKELQISLKHLEHISIELKRKGGEEMRRIYKRLLNLVRAIETADKETAVQQAWNLFKTEGESYLAYWRIRRDVKLEIRSMFRVDKYKNAIAKDIDKLHNKDEKNKIITLKEAQEFRKKVTEEGKKEEETALGAFEYGFKVAMRTIIVLFPMISYMNRLYRENNQLAQRHLIPIQMAHDMDDKLMELFKKLDIEVREQIKEVHAVESDVKKLAA